MPAGASATLCGATAMRDGVMLMPSGLYMTAAVNHQPEDLQQVMWQSDQALPAKLGLLLIVRHIA